MASSIDQNKPATVSCLCRKISYRVEKPPIYNTICHCTNCKKFSGSVFLTCSIFPKDALTILTGQSLLKAHLDTTTDSTQPLTREFCSECGSPLFFKTPLAENIVSVVAGSLDKVEGWVPAMEQYCRSRAGWLPVIEGLDEGKRHVKHPWVHIGEMPGFGGG